MRTIRHEPLTFCSGAFTSLPRGFPLHEYLGKVMDQECMRLVTCADVLPVADAKLD